MASSTAKHLALLSVSDKTGLLDLARGLHELGIKLVGSGGTAKAIRQAGIDIEDVSALTSSPEILGGRVKTLHPTVHGAILARLDLDSDVKDLQTQKIQPISIVVCNLYPFEATVAKTPTPPIAEAIEEIDIGGVTLLRAAAKNHARVSVLTAPSTYASFLDSLKAASGDPTALPATQREQLALSAFSHTAAYDSAISSHLRRTFASADNVNAADPAIRNEVRERAQQLTLRYGANPHQTPAQAFVTKGPLPFKVLCGSPGYINLLDALSSFSLVRELSLAFKPELPAAASFKHVSPAGAAVAHPSIPLTQEEIQVFGVDGIAGIENSPLAQAYARARGADRMSSFGDFIALSHTVDTATAKIIGREVSDGVIAPGYEPEALEILRKKKGGKYCVLQMDPLFKPDLVESRQVQGVTLEQRRNDALITPEVFANIVSSKKELPDAGLTDLTVATLALKYTQSNSVGFAYRGGIIGLGAGQQSRIHCTRLAGDKADAWWLRHHPRVLSLEFKKGVTRPTKANAIDALVTGQIWETEEGSDERKEWEDVFEQGKIPHEFSRQEKRDWMKKLRENGGGVACASDAFFPFADNVERAARSGVAYIAAPGGSVMDEKVVKTADDKGIVYAFSKYRLFTH